MSKFEWISIIISFVALAQPWIIKLWNSFFRKLKITFIPSGKMKLFYNRSGAYIQIGGVVEAKNQSATVKDISAKVTRCCDNAELKLNWCSFSVPSFQNIAGNIVTTTETARPFKVESNGLYPVFVEFCNADDIFLNNLSELHNRLIMKARSIPTSQMSLDDAQRIFQETSEYRTTKESLLESFYWKESKYILELVICYNDNRKKKAYYSFSLSKAEIADFKKDIDTAMNCAICNLLVSKTETLENAAYFSVFRIHVALFPLFFPFPEEIRETFSIRRWRFGRAVLRRFVWPHAWSGRICSLWY